MTPYYFSGLTETQTSRTLAHPFNLVLGDEAAQGSGFHGQADGPRPAMTARPPTVQVTSCFPSRSRGSERGT